MYRTKTFLKGLLVVSVAAMLCGYVVAAEQSTQRDRDRDQGRTTQQTQQATQQQTMQQQTMQMGAGAPTSGALHRTSKIIGKEVKGAQNENLGSIHDLVLTSDDQQISYAALSSGGALGIGAKYYAVPWSAFQVNSQGDITMAISKSQLEQSPAFDKNKWPSQPDWQFAAPAGQGRMSGQQSQMGMPRQSMDRDANSPAMDARQSRSSQSADRFGAQRQGTMDTDRDRQTTSRTGMGVGSMAADRDIRYHRVSHLTGMTVRNAQGEDIGNIEDFVIDAPQGLVAYTVVSFGGLWGIGEKYAAVPATAIQIQPRRNVARLDADRQTLEKIAFEPSKFPDLANPEYAQRLYQTFNAEPYWTVLGYVGSEQDQAAAQKAWGPEGEFAKHFDAKNVKTIEGTVQSVGTFQPEGAAAGAAGGLRIRLTTSDGNLVTVYAGPQWFAQQNDFYIKPGDKISVTGSETKIGWRPVLVASQIKAGDRTLRLRNENGQPVWQTQSMGSMDQGQRQGTMQQRPGQTQTPPPGSTGSQAGQTGTTGQGQPRQGQPNE